MRKISNTLAIFLGLFIFSPLFTSCGDDDKNNTIETKEVLIIGKWYIEKIVVNGIKQPLNKECAAQKNYSENLSNGIVKSYSFDKNCQVNINSDIKWTLDGNTYKETESFYNGTKHITEISVYTIKTLTESSMVLYYEKVYKNGKESIVDYDDDGNRDEIYGYLKKMN